MSHCSSFYQSSQTTHTTMSSLITPDGEDDDLVEIAETSIEECRWLSQQFGAKGSE